MNDRLYLLKIQLLGIRPPIWRRFVVPANINLNNLHYVIQIVMGWTNSHLHQFKINGERYTEDPEWISDGVDEEKYLLKNVIAGKGSIFNYEYDFGDRWEHKLIIEDDNYTHPELDAKLLCLKGKRACPPEDVGGIYGYYEFCEAMNDPDHEEHEYYVEWAGDDFDSEYFSLEEINWGLKRFLSNM